MFCGGRPVTEEHVVADWVRKLLGDQKPVSHTLYVPGKSIRQFPRAPHTLTAKVVCGPCNNGWMNELENGVKPHLANAIQRTNSVLLDASGHELIATWAAKTAMILESVGGTQPRLIPPEHFPQLFDRKTQPPDHTSVWIGAYGGTRFESLSARNAVSIGGGNELEDGEEPDPDFYLLTFSIRHLVVHVCGRVRDGATGYQYGLINPAFRRIHPTTGSFGWPPGKPLTDDALVRFTNT